MTCAGCITKLLSKKSKETTKGSSEKANKDSFLPYFLFLVVVVGWPEVLFGLIQYKSSPTYRKGNTLDSRTAVSTRVALFRLLRRKNWVNQGGKFSTNNELLLSLRASFTLCEKPAPLTADVGWEHYWNSPALRVEPRDRVTKRTIEGTKELSSQFLKVMCGYLWAIQAYSIFLYKKEEIEPIQVRCLAS